MTALGALALALCASCDLVAGIGEYCVEGEDPGCGTGGNAGTGGAGGATTASMGGGGTVTTSMGGAGGSPECTPPATQDCYTGPPDTKDVGICKGGTQACLPEGTWGACDGQVSPDVETCAGDADEDCDGTECAVWSLISGDAANQTVLDIAATATGEIIVLGYFAGELPIVQPPLASADASDLFLLKLSASGDVLWAKRWGGSGNQSSGFLGVDSSGNIFVAGGFSGGLDFGPGNSLTAVGSDDIYVAKVLPDGSTAWAKQFGDDKMQSARGIAISSIGEVVVAGNLIGAANFGDGNVTSAGASDIFVAKFASSGSLTWKRVIGGPSGESVNDMASDSSGNILISGYYLSSVVFGGTTLSNGGERYVAKMSSAGADVWAKSFPVEDMHVSAGVNGSWWLAGTVSGSIDFGGGTLAPLGGTDIYLAKFDSTGTYGGSTRLAGSGSLGVSDIKAGAAGEPVLAVQADGAIDFGGGSLTSAGMADVFLATFDDQLSLLWARRFGDDAFQGFGHLAVDEGFIYLGCKGNGTFNLGAGDLVSQGEDIVIAKLAR